jgi:hypothetical protein
MGDLKTFWTGLWTFLNSRVFVIILVVVLLMFAAAQCKKMVDKDREIAINEQNIAALTDSLKYEKNKNGDWEISKSIFISTIDGLKKLNEDLWKRVNAQGGDIVSLTHTVIRLKQDSAELAQHVDRLKIYIGELEKIDTNHFEAPWTLPYKYDNNNFFSVKGRTRIGVLRQNPLYLVHDTTYLTGFENQIDITFGEEIVKDKLRVYITSAFPGFSVKSMDGWMIDPATNPLLKKLINKKEHWFTGFGVGPNVSLGWNVLQAKPALIIGVGLHYNIYEF